MAISKKSALGVATEATPGTLMTTPTIYVPTKSMIKAKKKREYLMEERGDRNEEYDVVDTTRFGEWDIKGPFYSDAHGYFLLGALGSAVSTQQAATTAYKTVYTLADVPKVLSLFKSFDAKKYGCSYSFVEKFSIKGSSTDKLIEFDASGKSIWPSVYAGTFSPNFSTVRALAGYSPTITLTGGVTTDIDEWQVDFEQKVTMWTPANASQDWITAYFGARKVSFNFTARFDSDTLYQTYYRAGNVQDTLTIDIQGDLIASTYHEELNIVIPVTTYDDMEHDLGKDNVLIKAKGRGLATGSGAGNNLIQIFTISPITSYAT